MVKNLSDPNLVAIDKRKRGALDRAIAAGASRMLLSQAPFYINNHTISVTVATSKGSSIISKKKQFEDYKLLWQDPFFAPYTFVVSSTPSETMAQMVAMRLFLRATAFALKQQKGQPLWHPVYGGIRNDALRDDTRDTSIPFIVLSNVPDNATPYKFEKLRDIITRYSNVPKVIVTTSCDPVEFMTEKLKMPANFVMYLGAKKERRMV